MNISGLHGLLFFLYQLPLSWLLFCWGCYERNMARATYRRKNLFGLNGSGEIRGHCGGEAWRQASGIVVRSEMKDTSRPASIKERKQTGCNMKLFLQWCTSSSKVVPSKPPQSVSPTQNQIPEPMEEILIYLNHQKPKNRVYNASKANISAREMSQWVKPPAMQVWRPETNLNNPHKTGYIG